MRTILRKYQGLLVGIFGSVILFNQLIRFGSQNTLWIDNFDPKLIYWIVNWGYHVLFESFKPLGFWNANSFYPNLTTLAYSDSLLSAQIVYAPLRLMGIHPLTALYLMLTVLIISSCVLTSYALDRTGYFSIWEIAFIVFSAHFSLSMINYFGHYQLIGFELAPPYFLFLYLYLRDFRTKDLLTLSLILIIAISFAMYLAPILFIISFFLVLLFLLRWIRSSQLQKILSKMGIKSVLIILGSSLILYFIQIRPYIHISQQFPKQTLFEIAIYSANIHSIFDGFSVYSFWYDPGGLHFGELEYTYFPGYILLILGIISILLYIFLSLVHTRKKVKSTLDDKPNTAAAKLTDIIRSRMINYSIDPYFLLFVTILFILCIILSWGPLLKWNFSVHSDIKLPFYYLSKLFPGLDSIRAPGRFGIFISFPLSVLIVALVQILITSIKHRNLIVVSLLLGVIIEAMPTFEVYDFSSDPRGIYQQVAQVDLSESPLIELPVKGISHFDTINNVLDQLVGSTYHWNKLFVGYGSKFPDEYYNFLRIDKQIQDYETSPRRMFNFGIRYGVTNYLIHLDEYDQEIADEWLKMFQNNNACILLETEGTILFSVDPLLCGRSMDS